MILLLIPYQKLTQRMYCENTLVKQRIRERQRRCRHRYPRRSQRLYTSSMLPITIPYLLIRARFARNSSKYSQCIRRILQIGKLQLIRIRRVGSCPVVLYIANILLLRACLMRPRAEVAERMETTFIRPSIRQWRKRGGSILVEARLFAHASASTIAATEDAVEVVAFTPEAWYRATFISDDTSQYIYSIKSNKNYSIAIESSMKFADAHPNSYKAILTANTDSSSSYSSNTQSASSCSWTHRHLQYPPGVGKWVPCLMMQPGTRNGGRCRVLKIVGSRRADIL